MSQTITAHSSLKLAPLRRRTLAFFVPLLLIAFFLRIHNIAPYTLSRDEMASAFRTLEPTLIQAIGHGAIDSMWPAYHIPLYLYARLAGDVEYVLRLPSLFMGLLTLPAIYQAGRRLYTPREGLIGAVFAAANLTLINYSNTVRSYSTLVLFGVLSVYWFVSLLRECQLGHPRRITGIAFAATTLMVIYLHMFGALLVLIEALAAAVWMAHRRQMPRAVVVPYAAMALLVAPLMLTLPGVMAFDNTWINPLGPPYEVVWMEVSTMLGVVPGSALLLVGVGLVLLVAAWRQPQRLPPVLEGLPRSTWLLIIWAVTPVALLSLFSIVVKPALVPRYLLISVPAACLLLARLVTRLNVAPIWQAIAALSVTGVLLISTIPDVFMTTPPTATVREAVINLLEKDKDYPGSVIVWYAGRGKVIPDLEYYFRRAGSNRHLDIRGGLIQTWPAVKAFLAERKPRYVWFLRMGAVGDPAFFAEFNADLDRIYHRRFGDTEIWLYYNPAAEPGN